MKTEGQRIDIANAINAVTFDQIMSVYSGRHGCACGCVGNHWYASKHREAGSKNRGYLVRDAEISDRQVKRVLTKIKANALDDTAQINGQYLTFDTDTRMYVAYLLPKE